MKSIRFLENEAFFKLKENAVFFFNLNPISTLDVKFNKTHPLFKKILLQCRPYTKWSLGPFSLTGLYDEVAQGKSKNIQQCPQIRICLSN